ncbi:MAG: SDR family NAD(P)-dependent oxidoreductase [Burkholderiaceae bacterium]
MSIVLPSTPSFRLDGRRALVTGAGRGIGLAAAVALAQAGASVDLIARTESEVTAAAQAIAGLGHVAAGYALNILDTEAVSQFVATHGPYQLLVNNAGANRPATLLDVTEEDYDAVSDLNVKAAIFVTQAVVAGMRQAKLAGSIINIGSQMGHVGGPRRTVYCATKHAIEGMSKALAWELGPENIRVNTVCPTFIRTEMTAAMMDDPAFYDYIVSNIALGRPGKVEDLMGAIVFLAGDAAALVTGTSIMVDGGWTAA